MSRDAACVQGFGRSSFCAGFVGARLSKLAPARHAASCANTCSSMVHDLDGRSGLLLLQEGFEGHSAAELVTVNLKTPIVGGTVPQP